MALFRKLFYRKPPDGLLEICERVYVFDCCFTIDALKEQDYKGYVGRIISQLKEHYPDASILAFNFREGETQSQMANALTEYDMTIMEYPRQYEGCPLLPMEVIHHFLRSSESWLSLGLQNLLLMHCERGGWPVLAFMLAALLIYRKHYSGELKTLDMVYKQAPRELLQLLSPLNPIPSQLRYLQYVSRRNVATEWPPVDRALTMDCVIIRTIPNFDGEGGCRPIFRIYGQDPLLVSDRVPKVLFSTPKKSRTVRHYKQAECALVKIDINCHIQGDVVLECISLHDDTGREQMMFRVMFNTAFIRSNILMLNRDEIDILWDAKDLFLKDFRAEVLFSEMDTAASTVTMDHSCFEEKDGLPVEAFAKVQEFFSSVDWLVPRGDTAVSVIEHLTVTDAVNEAYSHAEKSQVDQSFTVLDVNSVTKIPADLTSENQSNFSQTLSPNTDVSKKQADPCHTPSEIGPITSPKHTLISPRDHSPSLSTLPPRQVSDGKALYFGPKKQDNSNALESDMAKDVLPRSEADTSFPKPFPSTPPSHPSKGAADVRPGQPLFSQAAVLSPLTASPEDKIGVQSGVPSLPLVPRETPNGSTPPLKDDNTTRLAISSVSAESSRSHVKLIGDGPPKIEYPPSIASSTTVVVETARVATPPTPPPPPCPTHSFSTVDVRKSSRFDSQSPPTSVSSAPNDIQGTRGGASLPNISSPPNTDVTLDSASQTPPPNLNMGPSIKENSASTCGLTPSTPLPHPTFPLKESATCGVGPPHPPPCTSHSTDSAAKRPAACPPPPPSPPPLPPLAPNESSPVRGVGTLPVSPTPPKPFIEKSSGGGPPCPPPPLHYGKDVPPSLPPPPLNPLLKETQVSRPPPPPPEPPKERTNGRPPPPHLSPPHSGQGIGHTNPPSLSSPPPPPAPPNYHGSTARSSPSIPSAPPPPSPSTKEPGSLSSSISDSGSRGGRPSGSPSPPPPSIPPPGTKGKSSLSRAATSKNDQTKKLKPLHWLKISRAVSGSLWAEAQKSGETSKAPEIDMSELESLFSAAVPNPDQGGSGRKPGSRAPLGHKSEKVQLIDHRRAYNCEIMLSKVKIPLHDMLSSVLALEDSALDVDQVDNLIKFCPTKDEMEMLKGYKGEKDKLGKCEQFFMELLQVPRIEYKLRVFSFKIQFHSQVSDLRKSLNVVNSAADQIRGSAKLKRIMQTILSLGNALNHGTARGSAIGFRLDSLLKLTETRARNNKMTLMHYLCKVLSEKLPEVLDFYSDLSSLEPASKVQLKFLAEEMQAINKGLEKVVQELSMSENDGPVSDQFRKALKEFLCLSEGEVRSLASLYAGVGRNVDSLILYFGEDPSRCPFEQVISTLLNFVRMFKQAHEENCKQLEFERKKAAKEASELKINASDTGQMLPSPAKSIK